MTTTTVEKIGYCAHESEQGTLAFEHAKELAKRLGAQLNVFAFLHDPYKEGEKPREMEIEVPSEKELAELERKLRMSYEEAAGDFTNIGFRLCHDNGWKELHRCLCNRQFQLLVLARPTEDAWFLGKPIEEFAKGFICPTILVGPDKDTVIQANPSADMLHEDINETCGGNQDWARL